MRKLSYKIYAEMIRWYPEDFCHDHAKEMQQTFADMVRDSGLLKTWLRVLPDFCVSVSIINFKNFMEQSSLQKKFALWGIGLITPFVLLLLVTIIGNAFELPMNNLIGSQISRSVHLAFIVIIILPSIAFILNLIPLAQNLKRSSQYGGVLTIAYARANVLSFVVAAVGIGIIAAMLLHDAVPCFVNGLINQHFHNIVPLFETCQNA